MIGSVQGSGLSAAAQAVNEAITPQGGANPSLPFAAAEGAMNKATSLAKTIGSIVTEHQPLETSGPRGTNVNILT
ncbi:MAG: hypothetical protein CMO05_03050 [Thalassospira sp.]|uniref:hypothetical protein n=1 Tax=Thalassospira sp. GB04J01 TaxID=1485225 RepID=UPI000C118DF8|nr:hypothetical protein [Thalassospira sp. GB04J01]MBV16434.1 hypothetical protein [Thalassospira sp.]|tara:strand:- start:65195 stop:65419 length:225 start_codon:yes stop_codon:yes gene_type:complete